MKSLPVQVYDAHFSVNKNAYQLLYAQMIIQITLCYNYNKHLKTISIKDYLNLYFQTFFSYSVELNTVFILNTITMNLDRMTSDDVSTSNLHLTLTVVVYLCNNQNDILIG